MEWRTWLFRILWLIGLIFLTIGLLTSETAQTVDAAFTPEASFPLAKAFHVTAYLGITLLWVYSRWPVVVFWSGVGFLIVHAAATEYLQQFIPYRTGTLRDVACDGLGIFLGLVLTYRVWLGRPAAPLAVRGQDGTAA